MRGSRLETAVGRKDISDDSGCSGCEGENDGDGAVEGRLGGGVGRVIVDCVRWMGFEGFM
jgi:hypothetical protein